MAQAKKLGAFGGVFTPSILTILGVIMYLRLPWIVGQAGLISAIAIVIVAHIISVTTGLSVSSISTDKKVKAGGTYYIISRSLGLPIGGTLGLALFVGLSFGVSLYLIGFSESFLSYWGFEVTKNNIRICGTIALLAVTTITFISTQLAIKSQFFIMSLIGLSLVAIFFGPDKYVPAEPTISSMADAAPWMVLFGIFFPAVTGFEAGVSMSGDLENPKRDIPKGTITAIVVGLFSYIGLCFFFAYRVDPAMLVGNSNVLLDIAIDPRLVVGGIWGATISSALGSILAAPRILQATSVDRITPKVFARGFGKENEPRNALMLTFVLVEAGILIGELDVIARIVSMFFITTYGFLNLSSALESWASSDFRPDFRIPRLVSVIGAVACFLVMVLLDFLAMVGATVALGAIFFYLKRRELTLESGDTWEGVWSSIVRTGLHKLYLQRQTHQRNWRPNIVLFSGGNSVRSHLVDLGRWLVYKRGVLTDFELVEKENKAALLSRQKQSVINDLEEQEGVFIRKIEVADVYQGMESIAHLYGFSGLDPNTILLGWGHSTRTAAKFTGLISSLRKQDYNVVLLKHVADRGFGQQKQIDIWWRGGGNNISLALTLLKFISLSEEWEGDSARLLVVTEDSTLTDIIFRNIRRILEELRFDVEIKVIQNGIEKRPFAEIISIESAKADLIILGLPEIDKENPEAYIERVNAMAAPLGSMLFVHASSYFEEIFIGVDNTASPPPSTAIPEIASIEKILPPLVLPEDEQIAFQLSNSSTALEFQISQFGINYLKQIKGIERGLVEGLEELTNRVINHLERLLDSPATPKQRKQTSRIQSDFLYQSQQIIQAFRDEQLQAYADSMDSGLEWLSERIEELVSNAPEKLTVFHPLDSYMAVPEDSFSMRWFKWQKRQTSRLRPKQGSNEERVAVANQVRFRDLLQHFLIRQNRHVWYGALQSFATASYQHITDIQKLITFVHERLRTIVALRGQQEFDSEILHELANEAEKRLTMLHESNQNRFSTFHQVLLEQARKSVQEISDDLQKPEINRIITNEYRVSHAHGVAQEQIADVPELWLAHQRGFLDLLLLDLQLKALQNRIRIIVQKSKQEIDLDIENNCLNPLADLESAILQLKEGKEDELSGRQRYDIEQLYEFRPAPVIESLLEEIRGVLDELPESVEIPGEDALERLSTQPFDDIELLGLSLRRLVTFLVEDKFIHPLQTHLKKLPAGFRQAQSAARDAIRLLSYNLESTGTAVREGEEELTSEQIASVARSTHDRIIEAVNSANKIHSDLSAVFEEHLATAFQSMNPYILTRSSDNLEHYLFNRESQKVISSVGTLPQRMYGFIRGRLIRLRYRRSETVLAAKRLGAESNDGRSPVDRLLELVEHVSPRPEILEKLPFYYRQLFLGQPVINRDLWIGRTTELAMAERALERFRRGRSGGILVTGEHLSGKSALSLFIANKHYDRDRVYVISPPRGGSSDPDIFLQALQQSLYFRGSLSQALGMLTEPSVIVFNGAELWWTRDEGGFSVWASILDSMSQYGGRHLFILNTNVYHYELLNRTRNIDHHFLAVIHCDPFDARDLKDAIMLRHRSSGWELELHGREGERFSAWQMAGYFDHLFDISRGNIGSALRSWVSSIRKFRPGMITIAAPEAPDFAALELLETDWIMILVQLLLHKRLTPERLSTLMPLSTAPLSQIVSGLERSGLVRRDDDGIIEVNSNALPHLVWFLRQKEII